MRTRAADPVRRARRPAVSLDLRAARAGARDRPAPADPLGARADVQRQAHSASSSLPRRTAADAAPAHHANGNRMPQLSVAQLFEDNREKLKLAWVAGRARRRRRSSTARSSRTRRGPDRPPEPHPPELDPGARPHRGRLPRGARCRRRSAQTLARARRQRDLACIIVAGGESAAADARATLADATRHAAASPRRCPAVRAHVDAAALPRARARRVDHAARRVSRRARHGRADHRRFGVGKSELALELITAAAGWSPTTSSSSTASAPETLEGRCPRAAARLPRSARPGRAQHPHHLRRDRGAPAQEPEAHRAPGEAGRRRHARLDRLPLQRRAPRTSWASSIRKVTIPVAAGRNLAVLVEAAVRNYVLQLRGIDSTQEFIERQAAGDAAEPATS